MAYTTRWSETEYDKTIHPLKVKRVGQFLGIAKKLKHQCLKCEAVWDVLPDNLIRGLSKCPMCSSKRRHMTTGQYQSLLVGRNIILLDELVGQKVKHNFQCTACDYIWYSTPDNILHDHGCPACSKDQANSGWKKRTKVRVGRRVVNLQGYEPLAVEWLKSVGCNMDRLLFNTDEGKPTFTYRHGGKDRLYIPDFYYAAKRRVIEVKSTWTLMPDAATFRRNCLKAKAAIAAGYEFCLILMSAAGERIKLPAGWYNMPLAELT